MEIDDTFLKEWDDGCDLAQCILATEVFKLVLREWAWCMVHIGLVEVLNLLSHQIP